MKHITKRIIIYVAIAIFFTACDTSTGSNEYTGFTWQPDGDRGIIITGYGGKGGSVEIPAEIDGLPVTAIGERAFFNNRLTSVICDRQYLICQTE